MQAQVRQLVAPESGAFFFQRCQIRSRQLHPSSELYRCQRLIDCCSLVPLAPSSIGSRLLQHYRAPPNERGSGKERGHGVELPICPACNEELEPGKHHNKCKAGRTTNPPSKRAPKASAAGSRSTKSARQAVVSKRLVAREPSGVDATCTPRNDTEHNSMGAPPTNTARCVTRTTIDDMDVSQGAFMVRNPLNVPHFELLDGGRSGRQCWVPANTVHSLCATCFILFSVCRCLSFSPAIRKGPRLDHKPRCGTTTCIEVAHLAVSVRIVLYSIVSSSHIRRAGAGCAWLSHV